MMTIPPPILLGISIAFIVVGLVTMPWLQEISLVLIIIGPVISIYAIAGLIGMAFRKKAPYLETDIKDLKKLPGVYPIVVGFFGFFALFRIFSDQLPENLIAPFFFVGLGGLFVFGIFTFIFARKRSQRNDEVSTKISKARNVYLIPAIIGGVMLLFVGAIYINSISTDVSEWVVFESEEDRFEVLLPTLPEQEEELRSVSIGNKNDRIQYNANIYSSRTEQSTYLVDVIDYPPGLSDLSDEALLQKFLEGIISRSSANKLVSSELTSFGDYKALDFAYTYQNRFYTYGKIIATDQTLYQISAIYYKRRYYSARDYEEFINSFNLK